MCGNDSSAEHRFLLACAHAHWSLDRISRLDVCNNISANWGITLHDDPPPASPSPGKV